MRDVRFGDLVLDRDGRRVRRGDVEIELQPLPLKALHRMIEREGALVTREELQSELWPDVIVTDQSLTQVVARLRRALGREVIRTVPHRGYRLGVPVTPLQAAWAPTLWFGRQDELEALRRWLVQGPSVLSLVGPGGVGKTSLARVLVHGREGTIWVDLEAATSSDDVLAAVASALGLRDAPPGPAADHVVAAALDARAAPLLVLDNFEQVVSAAPRLARWVAGAPRARVLVTTRQRLGLRCEQCLDVAPLGAEDALAMLRQRAELARPGAGAACPDDVGRAIVERVEGLPLALDIAGAWLADLPPRRLLERIGDLGARSAEVPERHASLAAVLAASWELLDPLAQRVVAQCALFTGVFDFDAARAVVDPDADLDRALASLGERSWLVREDAGYRLRMPARAWCSRAHAPGPEVVARYVAWWVAFAERTLPLGEPGTDAQVDRAWGARADLEAALDAADAEQASILGIALVRVLRSRSFVPNRAVQVARRTVSLARDAGPALLGAALLQQAAAELTGDVARASTVASEALALAEAAGLRDLEARARLTLGIADRATGRLESAQQQLTRALGLARTEGLGSIVGQARAALGGVALSRGRLDEAEALLRTALTELDGEVLEVGTLDALGNVLALQGRVEEAEAVLRQATRRAETGFGRAHAQLRLADLLLIVGQVEEAQQLVAAAVPSPEASWPRLLQSADLLAVRVAVLEGDPTAAIRLASRAAARLTEAGRALDAADAALNHLVLVVAFGDPAHASELVPVVRRAYATVGDPVGVALVGWVGAALAALAGAEPEPVEVDPDAARYPLVRLYGAVAEGLARLAGGDRAGAEAALAEARANRAGDVVDRLLVDVLAVRAASGT